MSSAGKRKRAITHNNGVTLTAAPKSAENRPLVHTDNLAELKQTNSCINITRLAVIKFFAP